MNRPPYGDEYRELGNHLNMFEVLQQPVPNMTVKIRAGSFWANGTTLVEFPGGNSPAVTKPGSGAKWVFVTVTPLATIALVEGAAAPNNPPVPNIPKGNLPCAAFYVQSNTTSLTSENIYDLRPVFHAGQFAVDHAELGNRNAPDAHPMTSIIGLSTAIADRPTVAELSPLFAAKADVKGTNSSEFTLNRDQAGVPVENTILKFHRGNLPAAMFRFNEAVDKFDYSVDGGTTWTVLGAPDTTDLYSKGEIDLLLEDKSDVTHNHDTEYSALSHDHAGVYSEVTHAHDLAYSAIDHNHDLDYAAIEHAHTVVDLPNLATRELHVDVNRVDTYVADGSMLKPFKTIQAAVDQIVANNDDALNPYNIFIQTGKYYENVVLESLNLHRVKLTGVGIVQIRPTTGNAFQSTTNNNNLVNLHVKGITFLAPVVITGQAGATSFDDHIWEDCNFVPGDLAQKGVLTLTCVNGFTCRRSFHYNCNVNLNNVNYGLLESCSVGSGSLLFVDMNDSNSLPSWGAAGGVILSGCILTGAPAISLTSASPYQFMLNFSRVATTASAITIPAGVIATANSSFLRGTWTNNGTLYLRNSFAQALAGTAPVLTQPASQIGNDSSVAGATVALALNELSPKSGAVRPIVTVVGTSFFDSNLSPARPIWWNGTAWVDSTGTVV